MIDVKTKRLPHAAGIELPRYQSLGAAGADVRAAVEQTLLLPPGHREAVPTGLVFQIPVGYEIQVRPRSGLAFKQGLTVVNAPGTIDSDYRGEVKVLLVNLGRDEVAVERGDRIAQLVVAPVVQAGFREKAELDSTDRGDGGFGSTGV